MWTYQPVVNVGVQVLVLMALGWTFARFRWLQQSAFLPPINYLILHLALPAFNIYLMGIKLDLQDAYAWRSFAAFLLWVSAVQAGTLLYCWRCCGGDAGEAAVVNMVLLMDNFGIAGLLTLNATLGTKWGTLSMLMAMGFFLTIFPFSLTAFEWEKWAVAQHVQAAAAAAAVDIEAAANTAVAAERAHNLREGEAGEAAAAAAAVEASAAAARAASGDGADPLGGGWGGGGGEGAGSAAAPPSGAGPRPVPQLPYKQHGGGMVQDAYGTELSLYGMDQPNRMREAAAADRSGGGGADGGGGSGAASAAHHQATGSGFELMPLAAPMAAAAPPPEPRAMSPALQDALAAGAGGGGGGAAVNSSSGGALRIAMTADGGDTAHVSHFPHENRYCWWSNEPYQPHTPHTPRLHAEHTPSDAGFAAAAAAVAALPGGGAGGGGGGLVRGLLARGLSLGRKRNAGTAGAAAAAAATAAANGGGYVPPRAVGGDSDTLLHPLASHSGAVVSPFMASAALGFPTDTPPVPQAAPPPGAGGPWAVGPLAAAAERAADADCGGGGGGAVRAARRRRVGGGDRAAGGGGLGSAGAGAVV